MWEIPPIDGLDFETDADGNQICTGATKTHVYQGVGVNNLEQAVLQGWVPVKEEEKVGTNWPVGGNGFRMFQEQVLCKMTRARWNDIQKDIDTMKEALSIETAEKDFRESVGEENAYGSISDG